MTFDTWVKLPIKWIRDDRQLRLFLPGDVGTSVAALKLYLVILGCVANPRWGRDGEERVGISYTQLTDWASVSRSLVGPALGKLEGLVSIRRGAGTRTSRYGIVGFPIPNGVGWGKLPISFLKDSAQAFEVFSARSRIDLAALKIYLLLVTFRDYRSGLSRLSYDKMHEYAAVSRTDIPKALSALTAINLISVRSGRELFAAPGEIAFGHNIYRVNGLFERRLPAAGETADGWDAIG